MDTPVPALVGSALSAPVCADCMLITEGRLGDAQALAVATGILIDGALAGVLDITGARRLGLELRRVVAGPVTTPGSPLMSDLAERIAAVKRDSPWGWVERALVFAYVPVRDELLAAGAIHRMRPRRLPLPLPRRRAFAIADPAALQAARDRADAARAGDSLHPHDIALASLLDAAGVQDSSRKERRRLREAQAILPPAACALLEILERKRQAMDSTGGWYADD